MKVTLVAEQPAQTSTVNNALTIYHYNDSPIQFDTINGRLMANATAMCAVFKKKPIFWLRNKQTQEFIEALESEVRIRTSADYQVVTTRKGNFVEELQGTWIDEELITHLAQWLDPRFALWCNRKIAELLRTGTTSIVPKTLSKLEWMKLAIEAETEKEAIAQELLVAAPKAEYHDAVLRSPDALVTGAIALELGMTAFKLNKILEAKGIQYKRSNRWFMHAKYVELGLAINKTHIFDTTPNAERTSSYLVWTEKGRQFIHNLFKGKQLTMGEQPVPIV